MYIYICTDIYKHVNTRGQALRHEWHVSHRQAALKARSLRPDRWRRSSSTSFFESSTSFFESSTSFFESCTFFSRLISSHIMHVCILHISTYVLQFFFGVILNYMYGSRMCNNIYSRLWLFSWRHLHCHFVSKIYAFCMYVCTFHVCGMWIYICIHCKHCVFFWVSSFTYTFLTPHISCVHVHE